MNPKKMNPKKMNPNKIEPKKKTVGRPPKNTKTVEATPEEESSSLKPIQLDLEELHKYKIMALSAKLEKERNRVREPIVLRKKQELQSELEKAFSEDDLYQEASKKQQESINEALKIAFKKLPEGYAVIKIDPEQGILQAEYNPPMAGKLIGEKED